MPHNLWPAREERTADDKRQVAANRAPDKEGRRGVRQRAQDTTGDQAHERQQRRPARSSNAALPTRSQDVKRAKYYEGTMLYRLTLELSGGEAVRLNEMLGRGP